MAKNDPLLVTEVKPGVTSLQINRPEARNALNLSLLQKFPKKLAEIAHRKEQRVLILHGAGPIFCSGLDLKEAQDPTLVDDSARALTKAIKALYSSPLVTIAAVHGAAIAGGGGVMAACDIVVAAVKTRIGFPETRRGLVAAIIITLLQRQIGDRALRKLLLAGTLIDTDQAKKIGLISQVCSEETLLNSAIQLADDVLKGAPNATRMSKKLLGELGPTSIKDDIDQALQFHLKARHSKEAAEGILAFTEKREPTW